MAILDVRNLKIQYRTKRGIAKAVDGVSFQIDHGDYLALVGESGCGKSTIAKALMRMLPPNGQYAAGEILFKGIDLVSVSRRELRKVLWKDISLIPQSAMHSFDPVYRVGDQIVEAIRTHEKRVSKARAWERAENLFEMVGLDGDRLNNYAHQFSGGMRQRGMIAMALALDPILVIADEPTTALDVIVQDQILARIKEIHDRMKKTMLLITHDIAVVSESCNKIAVMYAGKIMEYGDKEVLHEPNHPYTIGLVNAFPDMDDPQAELISIPGSPPDLINPPSGCRFSARCPFATSRCVNEEPQLRPRLDGGGQAACHYIERSDEFRHLGKKSFTWATTRSQGLASA